MEWLLNIGLLLLGVIVSRGGGTLLCLQSYDNNIYSKTDIILFITCTNITETSRIIISIIQAR